MKQQVMPSEAIGHAERSEASSLMPFRLMPLQKVEDEKGKRREGRWILRFAQNDGERRSEWRDDDQNDEMAIGMTDKTPEMTGKGDG
jgi:hypothetical protein